MIKFSTWYFERFNNLDDVIALLNENRSVVNYCEHDDRQFAYNINEKEGFPLNEANNITICGQTIRFIFLNVTIERLRRLWDTSQPIEEGVIAYPEDVLIYEDGGQVKFIVLSTRKNALRVIKFMFPVLLWGNIVEENFVTRELLYWIFYRLRNFENTEELSENSNLYLMGLKSYMGKTKDEANAVRGSGVRIAAILGTLAFIFNNADLQALRPEFQYNGHTIVSEIHLNNGNRIYENFYQGSFMEYEGMIKNIAILIFTCNDMMPRLAQCYQENVDNQRWSDQIKLNFLQEIGNSIRSTVDAELQRISSEMNRFNEYNDDFIDEEIENEEFDEE